MKRWVASVLVLIMVACMSSGLAEELDLKACTNDDLRVLKTSIDGEMLERGMVKSATLDPGTYYIGVDIPAGSYSIILAESDQYKSDYYQVFSCEEKLLNEECGDIVADSVNQTQAVTINLKEGYILKFGNGPIKISKSQIIWE